MLFFSLVILNLQLFFRFQDQFGEPVIMQIHVPVLYKRAYVKELEPTLNKSQDSESKKSSTLLLSVIVGSFDFSKGISHRTLAGFSSALAISAFTFSLQHSQDGRKEQRGCGAQKDTVCGGRECEGGQQKDRDLMKITS